MTAFSGPIQHRNGAALSWTANNPTLLVGEIGVESDTGRFKIGDGTTAWTGLDYGAAEPILPYTSTGLLDGGSLAINADPSKFDVSAVVASFFDDATDPLSPDQSVESFAGQTAVAIPGIGTRTATYVGYQQDGTLVQSANPFTATERRTIVSLGVLVHSNLVSINAVNPTRQMGLNALNQVFDLMQAVGPINVTGNRYTPGGANLTLQRSAGSIFKFGAGLTELDPHTVPVAASAVPITNLRYRTRNGEVTGDITNIIPGSYDLNGVVTAVPTNDFTIQRIFMFSSGLQRIQYGQATYTSLVNALDALATRQENFVVEANMVENGLLRGFLVVRNNCTNLQDAATARVVSAMPIPGPQG